MTTVTLISLERGDGRKRKAEGSTNDSSLVLPDSQGVNPVETLDVDEPSARTD